MKLITFTQGTNPRCGLALSDTIGIDLAKADPTLPPNWHALLPDMTGVRRVWDEQSPQLEALVAGHERGSARAFTIDDVDALHQLVAECDLAISLLIDIDIRGAAGRRGLGGPTPANARGVLG